MEKLRRFRLRSGQARRAILIRYALFQIPDLLIVLVVLAALDRWVDFHSRWIWGVIVLWIVKDVALFPFVWAAYERPPSHAREALVGAAGVAVEKLNPDGYVRVGGVLWRAETMGGSAVDEGGTVVVDGVDGSILLVRPDDGRKKNAELPSDGAPPDSPL